MELTVYRQASKERADGTVVYKGEDALPFVDDSFFLVADGLGGAAAIRHQKFNAALFDVDKLLDTLFRGVYEDYSDVVFDKYVKDSFMELFAVKDCYYENVNNMKKSGYFASRIVSAIMLHEVIYNKNLKPDTLFSDYESRESEKNKQEFLRQLENYFAFKIGDDIRKIAKNASLFYESSYSGLALLGSTLCATIFHEKDDCVEAIYITAGDSRPYVWSETEGLCQIVEDQEGKDGGMTNYIKANEGENFEIRCNYMCFKKPCVLFNASDGCFDSAAFLSPMAFEKIIIQKALSTNNTVSMGNSLQEFFLTYGKHDDSSTIAMKFFGYESFDAFKDSAKRRWNQIDREYISEFPDLLEKDYLKEYNERMSAVKSKFENDKDVKLYCIEQMEKEAYPPYEVKKQEISKRKAEIKRQLDGTFGQIKELVARNYIECFNLVSAVEGLKPNSNLIRIENIVKSYQKYSEDYLSLIGQYQNIFEKTDMQLRSIISNIASIGVPLDFSAFDGIDSRAIKECANSKEALFDFFDSLKNKKQSIIKKLIELREDYTDQNIKYASKDEDNLNRVCDVLIYGNVDINKIKNRMFGKDFENLISLLSQYHEVEKEYSDNSELIQACGESRGLYWKENYERIITAITEDTSVSVSQELRDEAKATIEELNNPKDELKMKAEKQDALFRLYNQTYCKYLGGMQK